MELSSIIFIFNAYTVKERFNTWNDGAFSFVQQAYRTPGCSEFGSCPIGCCITVMTYVDTHNFLADIHLRAPVLNVTTCNETELIKM